MSDQAKIKALEERVARLERELRGRRQQSTTTDQGTRDRPLTRTYYRDPKTGTVARVEYDSATGALVPTKE